jgi:uncharacterized membrane protein YbhN (UPF0104 family)
VSTLSPWVVVESYGPPNLGVLMSDATNARPALDIKKSIILGVFGLAVIILIFVRVIPQIGSYHRAVTSLEAMTAGALACIVVSVVVYLAAYGFPFMAATPGLPYWRSQQVNQGAFAISNGVPAGGAFGLGVQYAMLASYGVGVAARTAAITSVGIWSIFVTLGLPILGVAAIQLSGQAASSYVWAGVVGVLALAGATVAFAMLVRSENVARWIGSVGNRIRGMVVRLFRRGHNVDFVPMALEFRSQIADLVERRWAAITVAQLSVTFTQFLIFFMSLRGVEGWGSAGTTPLVAFGGFAVAQIGLMIPITPGGLGTVDAAMIALLTALGVDAGAATAADLVWRAASFVPQIIVGVVALIVWSRQGARAIAQREAEHGGQAGQPEA